MTAAPTPGIAPISTPKTDWRIIMRQRFRPSRDPRQTSRVLTTEPGGATGRRAMARSTISGNAKKPMVTAMMGSPVQSCGWSKTYRRAPVIGLMPTVPSKMPKAPAVSPFTMAPALNAATIAMPKNATAATSAGVKARMTGLLTGMSTASTTAPTMPPSAETA